MEVATPTMDVATVVEPDSPAQVNITWQDGLWSTSGHKISRLYRAVTFINLSDRPCLVLFSKPSTFGVSLIGLVGRAKETLIIEHRNRCTEICVIDGPPQMYEPAMPDQTIVIDP